MAASYVVRPLSPSEASAGAHAWSELADGTISPDVLRRIQTLLTQAGTHEFAAFVAERYGELCGIATARLVSHPVSGTCGEIEALMIDERLPDEAGDALAHAAIEDVTAVCLTGDEIEYVHDRASDALPPREQDQALANGNCLVLDVSEKPTLSPFNDLHGELARRPKSDPRCERWEPDLEYLADAKPRRRSRIHREASLSAHPSAQTASAYRVKRGLTTG